MSVYEPGRLLGDHVLLERLGRGGMGEVWLARHVDRGERVAIKVLFPRPDRRAEARERFAREVEAATRIGHPAIVRVHGCGTDESGGSMFIVMERLEGANFRAWLAAPDASVLEGLTRIRELLEPLAAAHACTEGGRAAPIIHRDLKPENVFVLDRADEGGRVKLLDFGIARQAGGTHVTDTGVGMGTAAYMCPEQATDAREVGPSADVWSVGVMLYEILAGRLPFDAPSRNEIISKILTRDPLPLESLAPHVPRRLARLVRTCLTKEPSRRPADARALAIELDAILADASARRRIETLALSRSQPEVLRGAPTLTSRSAAPRAQSRVLLPALAALALLAALVIALWSSSERAAPRPGPRPAPRLLSPTPDAALAHDANRWIAIAPGTALLGVDEDALEEAQSGFRPSARVRAPAEPYEIQQREVTWGEIEEWLPASTELSVLRERRPAWLPADRAARARLPASGVPWELARDYCASLGGSLPSEEQWEHAARGAERRPYTWGGAAPDPARTNLGAAEGARLVAVTTRAQDRTPGEPPIYDLTGNAREWTRDVWRDASDGRAPAWAQEDGRSFRAVRGLPLATEPHWRPPAAAPIAHRIPLCATGECPAATDDVRLDVGFRCVR